MIKHIFSIISLVMMAMLSQPVRADVCPYCKGMGYVVMNPDNTSGYGQQPIYSTCPICHQSININGGPAHKHQCSRCGGTGRIPGSGSSSSADRSSGTGDPLIKGMLLMQEYGIQLSQNEWNTLNAFISTGTSDANNFNEWYKILQQQVFSWNYSIFLKTHTNMMPECLQSLVNVYEQTVARLNAIHFSIPQDILNLQNNMISQFMAVWNTYYEKNKLGAQMNQQRRDLENSIIYGTPLPNTINITIAN